MIASSGCQNQQQGKEEQVSFEKLPDELMVQIFSHLSPEDLACRVSKVCVKWSTISKDVTLWENTSLVYDDTLSLEFQQTIQFAPMFLKVEINMFKFMDHDTIMAILGGCAAVKYLSFYPNQAVPVKEKLKILDHFQSSLEELNIYIDDSFLSHKESSECLFHILTNMVNLKVLTLRGCVNSEYVIQEPLRNVWGKLESLDISELTVMFEEVEIHPQVPNPWQRFILHILENQGQRLKKLSLPLGVFDFSMIPMLEAKFVSSVVENLKICEMCLSVVKKTATLKTLHVVGVSHTHLDQLRKDCLSSTIPYVKILDWLTDIPHLLSVTDLALENISDDERSFIFKVINACRNLKSLTLYSGIHTAGQFAFILSVLPPLKRLNIHRMPWLKARHLDLICFHLPNLELLNLRHNTLTDGILQHYRDNVQSRMPNLQLCCDWGYWNKFGGRHWSSSYHSNVKLGLEHTTSPNDLQCHDRAKIRRLLNEIYDYDDDD